jgi:serine/threonine protein kinase
MRITTPAPEGNAVPTITCPSEHDLLGFHLGTLPETGLDLVGDHLETCPECQDRVQALDSVTDSVLSVLGGSATAEATAVTEHTPHGISEDGQGVDFLSPARAPDEIGRLGPHYIVRRLLGRGGMGMVFAAEDTRLGRQVAVKVMKRGLAAEPDARQRFLREARAMASVAASPHLVPIYDVGEENGVPYLAMELLQGEPLDRRLERGPALSVAEILRFGRGIAAGLAVAHGGGFVHRDIKPGNLWVQAPGDTIKILDFGLVRTADDNLKLTRSGVIAGTPAYLSPEQVQEQPLDARTDLFSLGCVLYEMCAAQPPFRGRTAFALLNAVTASEPMPLSRLRPDLPSALADLVRQLMAKRPADRPQSAQAVVDRLDAIVQAPPPRRRSRRGLVALLLAAGTLILIAATVLHVRTSKGLVEIRSDDPKIRVTVEQDGELITILDPVSKQQVELRAGAYQVKLSPEGAGLQLSADQFTLRRGGKEVLTVRRLDDVPKAADAAWVRRVAALPAAEQIKAVTERLRKLNPGFKADVSHKIEKGIVVELDFITENVHDISPLRALTGLQRLTCFGGDRKLTDLSPLRGLKLTQFNCGRTGVVDFSPLAGMPLTDLRCDDCLISDLSSLRGLELLAFNCAGTPISNLEPLSKMPLQWLGCNRTKVDDLTPLKGMKLTGLRCDDTAVKEITALAGMPLGQLNLGNTRVRDLGPLKKMPLTILNIGGSKVADLTPIKGLPLTRLDMNSTAVADLSPLKGMPLSSLWMWSTKVTSLAPLKGIELSEIFFDAQPDIDFKVLRTTTSLLTINGQPPKEFWRKHDKN